MPTNAGTEAINLQMVGGTVAGVGVHRKHDQYSQIMAAIKDFVNHFTGGFQQLAEHAAQGVAAAFSDVKDGKFTPSSTPVVSGSGKDSPLSI